MPFALIKELNTLMSMSFPAKTECNDLTTCLDLPDEVYDQLDKIADCAKNIFGKAIKPNERQADIMAQNKFPIVAGDATMTTWRSGVIQTPKGRIVYR